MELITRYARIASAVQMAHKLIHQKEESNFVGIGVFTIQQIDHIASETFVLGYYVFIPGSR